jgi:hypothetical protein
LHKLDWRNGLKCVKIVVWCSFLVEVVVRIGKMIQASSSWGKKVITPNFYNSIIIHVALLHQLQLNLIILVADVVTIVWIAILICKGFNKSFKASLVSYLFLNFHRNVVKNSKKSMSANSL